MIVDYVRGAISDVAHIWLLVIIDMSNYYMLILYLQAGIWCSSVDGFNAGL